MSPWGEGWIALPGPAKRIDQGGEVAVPADGVGECDHPDEGWCGRRAGDLHSVVS